MEQPPPPNPPPVDLPPPQTSTNPSPLPSTTTTPNSSQIPIPNPNPNPSPNPNKPPQLTPSPQPQPPNSQSRLARPQQQPSHHLPHSSAPYSPSFGQHQFGGLGRGATVNAPPGPITPQVRPQAPGYQSTVSSANQMRPGAISVHQQQRPTPVRSITNPNNQPTSAQNLSGHNILRGSSVGSPGLNSPSAAQIPQLRGQPQPWLAQQGRPPLPSYRGHMDTQPTQQRAHGPSQYLQASSSHQQPQAFSSYQQDQFRQAPSVRPGSSISPQPQTPRVLGQQRPSTFGTAQPVQQGTHNNNAAVDANESSNSILSKRSIHELVNQVDPSEKLDPEVVDILVDIAEDFVDSITTFGCSLAKHRKSNTLEAKDILLHLERNWNLTIPGFGGDEIKSYRKPAINDIHRERIAAVKKSIGAEAGTARNLPGQQAPKGLARAPGGAMDSQQ